MPVTTRVIDVPGRPAGIAGVEMPTECRSATGDDSAPDPGSPARQGSGSKIGRTEGAEHLGQTAPVHAPRSVWRKQFEWRGGTGQLGSRQMQIAHRGRDMTVPKQALDGVQVGTGFEQVGGKAMA